MSVHTVVHRSYHAVGPQVRVRAEGPTGEGGLGVCRCDSPALAQALALALNWVPAGVIHLLKVRLEQAAAGGGGAVADPALEGCLAGRGD